MQARFEAADTLSHISSVRANISKIWLMDKYIQVLGFWIFFGREGCGILVCWGCLLLLLLFLRQAKYTSNEATLITSQEHKEINSST